MVDSTGAVGKQSSGRSEVVSAIDRIDDTENLVVADITRDDAWVAMSTADTVATAEWR